jgi:hypothetical protein
MFGRHFFTPEPSAMRRRRHPETMSSHLTQSLARLCLLVAIGLVPPSARSAVLPGFRGDFQSELRFPSGGVPISIAVGDFNSDGKLDMVVANSADGTVGVYLGKGDGTFLTPVFYPVGDFPIAVVVGDFNADGKPDIAVANFNIDQLTNGDSVSVLIGNGDGTFQPAVDYVVGTRPIALVIADLDGNGTADIAVANNSDNTISVLLGKGDGTFQAPTTYPSGVGPHSMAAADFNGDGKLDLAIANCPVSVLGGPFECPPAGTDGPGSISVLLGNGDGTFQKPLSLTVLAAPYNIAAGDLNGDGKPDIVATHNVANGSVSVLVGHGDGSFDPAVTFPGGNHVEGLAIADFNGDGKLDIVTGSANHQISELLGNGDATFQPAVNYAVGVNEGRVSAIGDFNGDGRPDIAVVTDNNIVSVFLNAGGLLRQATTVTVSSNMNPSSLIDPLTITVTVTSDAVSLGGSATFTIDGNTLFSDSTSGLPIGALNSSGQATLSIPPLSLTAGAHSIVAVYSGDTQTQGSVSSPFTQIVTLVSSSTQLMSSQNPSALGQPITLTAIVSPQTPLIGETGTVTFQDGATVLTTLPVQPLRLFGGGQASFTTSTLSAGTHPITAEYSGDEVFAASTSSVLEQVVQPLDFSVIVPPGGSTTQTVNSGQTATYNLVLTPEGGFSGTVTMGCSGAPPNATCSVNPLSLSLNAASPANFSVSVTTASSGASLSTTPLGPAREQMVILTLALILGPFAISLIKRARVERSFSVVLTIAIMGLCGCGGGNTSPVKTGHQGTPPGSYALVVTANSGATSHSLSLNLIVQ